MFGLIIVSSKYYLKERLATLKCPHVSNGSGNYIAINPKILSELRRRFDIDVIKFVARRVGVFIGLRKLIAINIKRTPITFLQVVGAVGCAKLGGNTRNRTPAHAVLHSMTSAGRVRTISKSRCAPIKIPPDSRLLQLNQRPCFERLELLLG
jgi:hypothetical protein